MDDASLLERAIDLAVASVAAGGGPFGALVAVDGRVVGEGSNRVTVDLDPTAHAEVVAIRAACRALGRFALHDGTLFSSCEPCPMCLAAAHWARLDRIVYAADRAAAAAAGFDDVLLYEEVAKANANRRRPLVNLPLQAASAPFDAWAVRAGRTAY